MSSPCPLCGNSSSRDIIQTDFNLTGATPRRYRVVECRRCRFRYLNPRPDARALAQFYAADYPAYTLQSRQNGSLSKEQISLNRRLRRIADHRLALVQRFLNRPWTRLRVLDIGCGSGSFLLELARRYRVEAWGLDIAAGPLADLARGHPELRLVTGDLASVVLPAGYFDLITLWHVLEHEGDPVATLRCARNLLRPGGLLVAEVPNSVGLIARICGRSWLGWDLPRHLVHFTPPTLREAGKRAGFGRLRVLREYTLNPICLSPLLASLAIWRRRRQGRTRMKHAAYHRWDGLPGAALHLLNGVERLLGNNGLVLVARSDPLTT